MEYSPEGAPDRSVWFETSEVDRIDAVLHYHKRARERTANARLHASIHVAVETQIAQDYAATVCTMERLLAEGLDRHDAIHAIGSVLAEHMYAAFHGQPFDAIEYEAQLVAVTAESWRKSGGGT